MAGILGEHKNDDIVNAIKVVNIPLKKKTIRFLKTIQLHCASKS